VDIVFPTSLSSSIIGGVLLLVLVLELTVAILLCSLMIDRALRDLDGDARGLSLDLDLVVEVEVEVVVVLFASLFFVVAVSISHSSLIGYPPQREKAPQDEKALVQSDDSLVDVVCNSTIIVYSL